MQHTILSRRAKTFVSLFILSALVLAGFFLKRSSPVPTLSRAAQSITSQP
ncbi:MAG: hypothetical protein H7308_07290 [Chthonomonadaceae bacterium]|nr:hypothetical protein [Chthonomonadaceae bacterium]